MPLGTRVWNYDVQRGQIFEELKFIIVHMQFVHHDMQTAIAGIVHLYVPFFSSSDA